jgi:hypothetical protein
MIVENINSVFTFGKHKNKSLKEVALIDPCYIEWLCKEVKDFDVTLETLDALHEYCLSQFFTNPETYLNEKGSFTLTSWQHLKLGSKEATIGIKGMSQKIADLKLGNKIPHIATDFARKVFDREVCIKNLKERIEGYLDDDEDYLYEEDDNSMSTEELRRLHNDAYEIDSNEFDGWHEPTD